MADLNADLNYHIKPARYAKGMMAVTPARDGSGWKTLAALLISEMPGVRWSNREHAYICTPSRAAKFEAAVRKVLERRTEGRQ